MGAYNLLISNYECSNCRKTFEMSIQFKYGDTWQIKYRLGDVLRWGGNDIGASSNKKVEVYGIAENSVCPQCGFVNIDEFDVLVKDNAIVAVSPLKSIESYKTDPDGNFYSIE